jgi:hypothetical protein
MKASGKIGNNGAQVSNNVEKRFEIEKKNIYKEGNNADIKSYLILLLLKAVRNIL